MKHVFCLLLSAFCFLSSARSGEHKIGIQEIEFSLMAAPACGAGKYVLFVDSTLFLFRKCVNGVITDLDTGGIGLAISDTTGDLAASRVDDGGAASTQALFSGGAGAAGFRAIADGDIPAAIARDSELAFANLSGAIAAAQQNAPAVGAKGGVESKTCSGTDKLSAIGTDGIPVCSADQTGAGSGAGLTRIAGSSGAAGADLTWQNLSADCATNATTTLATCMTTTGVGAGLWKFKYTIIYVSSATTTGVAFAVNHTGTTSTFVSSWWMVSTGAAAATGVGDQVSAVVAGQMVEGKSERVKNTATTASAGVDTTSSNMMAVLEGLVRVTATGSLELRHASETANSTQVKADTTLELHKIE